MDARQAREFAERGGAVLLLDVPAGTSMSVDHQVHHGLLFSCFVSTRQSHHFKCGASSARLQSQ